MLDTTAVTVVLVRRSGTGQWLTGDCNLFLQLERFSLPMFYFFQTECRRWAPMCRSGWFLFYSLISRGFFLSGFLAWTLG